MITPVRKLFSKKIKKVRISGNEAKIYKRILEHVKRDFADWKIKYGDKNDVFCPPWLDLPNDEQVLIDELFHILCPGDYCVDPLSYGQVNRWMYEQIEKNVEIVY